MLLNTHAALWLRAGDAKLGSPLARAANERAWQTEEVAMAVISFWEMAMLREKGSIASLDDVSRWRLGQLGQGLIEIPVDGETGIRANILADFHADPADRIIIATAMNGYHLVTADQRILDWSGGLRCVDAAR